MTQEDPLFFELTQRQPARLLAEGAAAQSLLLPYLATHPECKLITVAEPADVAVAQIDAQFAKAESFALIGRLKQVSPAVLVVAGDDPPLNFSDFLSLGMQRLVEADAHGHALYLFDLHTYKPAPDWLNARFWANPERWKP